MMRRTETPMLIGILLIGAGALSLLANFGLISPLAGLAWAGLLGLGGAMFLALYARNHAHWWALIPGSTLLGLGGLIGLQELAPSVASAWGGGLFLGGISLGFWLIYLTQRARWWAIIPGGVLLSVALIAGLADRVPGEQSGALLFYGMALTFGAVYLAAESGKRHVWALFPAGVLLAIGLVIQTSFAATIGLFWPIVMIGFGLYLAYKALWVRPTPQPPVAEPLVALAIPPAQPDDMQHLEGLVNRAVGAKPALSEAAPPTSELALPEELSEAIPPTSELALPEELIAAGPKEHI